MRRKLLRSAARHNPQGLVRLAKSLGVVGPFAPRKRRGAEPWDHLVQRILDALAADAFDDWVAAAVRYGEQEPRALALEKVWEAAKAEAAPTKAP